MAKTVKKQAPVAEGINKNAPSQNGAARAANAQKFRFFIFKKYNKRKKMYN